MEPQLRAIEWEALEHHHEPKNSDWFWILGILTLSGAVTSLLLKNTLLSIIILLGGAVMAVIAVRPPKTVEYAITPRGVRIESTFYPYTSLEAYCIEEHPIIGHQLLIRSQKMFMPLLIFPLPEEHVEEIEDIVAERLPEDQIEEPFANKLLEFFGF